MNLPLNSMYMAYIALLDHVIRPKPVFYQSPRFSCYI